MTTRTPSGADRRGLDGRAAVRDALLADLEAVANEIVAAVRLEIPAYDSLAPAQLDEVSRIAAWGTSRVLDAWVSGEELGDDDLVRFRGIGAARALDGRPLPVVLRAYRVAGSTVTDQVARRARGLLDVDDALALARLWMTSVDALSEALYAGHVGASERLEGDHTRALADFTDDLVAGRHATSAALAARAGRLGLSLPRRVLLLHATAVGDHSAAWPTLLEELLPEPAPRLARLREGVGTVLLTGEQSLRRVEQHLTVAGWRGVALERPVQSLARGSRLGLHALDAAPTYAWQGRALLDEVDALATAQATGHPDADVAALVDAALGPLAPHPHLRQGLGALLATGSVTGAATAGGHHVQTLHHRLRRIRALTGRDPRRPWDRFVLELATLVDR